MLAYIVAVILPRAHRLQEVWLSSELPRRLLIRCLPGIIQLTTDRSGLVTFSCRLALARKVRVLSVNTFPAHF